MRQEFFIPLSMKEFRELLRSTIREELSDLVEDQQHEPLIKSVEAAKILGVSKVTLLDWRRKGLIPFHQLNSRIYYKKSELMEALSKAPKGKGRRGISQDFNAKHSYRCRPAKNTLPGL